MAAAGCGSDSNDGHIRLINDTVSHSSLDFYVGTDKTISGVAISTASSYADVETGNPTTSVDDTGSTTALGSFSPTVSKDQHSAILAYESSGKVYFAIISEETTEPDSGYTNVQFRNFSYDAGSLDIYLVAHNANGAAAAISGATANYTSTAPSAVGTAAATVGGLVTPGTYDIVVTAASNQADIRLYMPSIVLANQAVDSVLLTPTAGGILVDGALMVQQGAYTPYRNTLARVKLVNGTASNNVTLSSGSSTTAVATSISSFTVGAYTSVTAASGLSATVSSQSVQVSPSTLTAGTDYSVLVSGNGSSSAPYAAALLTDDNHLPTTSGDAKIRLVNGFTAAGAASLVVDSYQVASQQAYDTASSYAQVVSNTASTFVTATQQAVYGGTSGTTLLTDPCSSKLYPNTNSTTKVSSGSVYSLYVLGDNSTSPANYNCVLRADR